MQDYCISTTIFERFISRHMRLEDAPRVEVANVLPVSQFLHAGAGECRCCRRTCRSTNLIVGHIGYDVADLVEWRAVALAAQLMYDVLHPYAAARRE